MNNPLSTLYKEQGVVHDTPRVSPTTPLEEARRLAGRRDLTKVFAIDPMACIVDERLPDKAFRVRAFIAACSWDGRPCPLAFGEIAFAVKSSRPQVIRHVKLLGKLGYIEITHGKNHRNSYLALRSDVAAPASADKTGKAGVDTPQPVETKYCPHCRRTVRRLGKEGLCRGCTDEAALVGRLAAARVELGPDATPEELAAHLKNAKLAARIRRVLEKAA